MVILIILCAIWVLFTILMSVFVLGGYYIILWFFVGLLGVVLGFILFLVGMLPYFKHSAYDAKFKHFLGRQCMFIANRAMNLEMHFHGRENIKKDETYFVVSNHKSQADATISYEAFGKPTTLMAKKEVADMPFIKYFLNSFHIIFVDRDNDREALKSAIDAIKTLQSGYSIILFPEGGIKTRETELMVDVKPGCYKIPMKSNTSILPMVIIGSSKICGSSIFKRKRIDVYIYPAITPDFYQGKTTQEVGSYIFDFINKEVEKHAHK